MPRPGPVTAAHRWWDATPSYQRTIGGLCALSFLYVLLSIYSTLDITHGPDRPAVSPPEGLVTVRVNGETVSTWCDPFGNELIMTGGGALTAIPHGCTTAP